MNFGDTPLTSSSVSARHFMQNRSTLCRKLSLLLVLGFFACSIAHGQDKERKPFAVEPLKDWGTRELPALKGLIVEGKARFSIPEGAKPLEFPNENLSEVVRGWPAGGWGNLIRRVLR